MSLYTFLYKGQVYDTVTVDNVLSAFHSSVLDLVGFPPKAKAPTVVPAPPGVVLAVPKSFNSVQEEPFQNSVVVCDPGSPPK